MNHIRSATVLMLSLAVLLVGCGTPTQPASFTIRLEPPTLSLRIAETGTIKVIVSRSAGFAEAVLITLGGDSSGLEADPLSIVGSEGTLNLRATDAAKTGTRFPVVQAKSGSISKTETLTLRLAKPVAEVSKVSVQNNGGSVQVRQGFGEVVLGVEGKNLDRVTAFKLGDLDLTLLPGRTATSLSLKTRVLHGASLGTKNLLLSTEGGDTEVAALVVSPITSGPSGNDSSGAGTPDKPFRSLTKALSLSAAGDTVRLLNGTYSATSGEAWPTDDGVTVGTNVPPGVQIEGESVTGTVLLGPGASNTVSGLSFAGNGTAKSLTTKGFLIGFRVTTGDVTLEEVTGESSGAGFKADGGTSKITDSNFKTNTIGILLDKTATVEVIGGASYQNSGYGIYLVAGSPKLKASGLSLFSNGAGLWAMDKAEVVLERTKLHDHRTNGLLATNEVTLSLSDCELYNNADAGLTFSGKSLLMRGTTIRNNRDAGLVVSGAPSKVDLGNFTQPGNNDLHGNSFNGTTGQILDSRLYSPQLGSGKFTVSATKLSGLVPKADIYTGQYKNLPYFEIVVPNLTIEFW